MITTCEVNRWTDEKTGLQVRQLTDLPQGAGLFYFRFHKHLPDGRMLCGSRHETGTLIAVDPQSGHVELLPGKKKGDGFRLQAGRNLMYLIQDGGRSLWCATPTGQAAELVYRLPKDLGGCIEDISCDGRYLIIPETEQDLSRYPIPTTKDVKSIWHFFSRPRRGWLHVIDLQTQQVRTILYTEGICPLHIDASPTDPTLIRYCHDMYDAYGQRVWTIRVDGSQRRPIRPQQWGELVTHEFWWPDGQSIGYTYQDRRQDPTLEALPWAEYSPTTTHLGVADLEGREQFLSGSLGCYHSHVYVSRDGKWISGEGTDGHSFVYAGRYQAPTVEVAMRPLAQIHTTYVPFRGQGVNCDFSIDNRWLLYGDTIAGKHQICAVEVPQ